MIDLKPHKFWFATGSQHLYGQDTLRQVDEHSKIIVEHLNKDEKIPFEVVFKPVLTNPEAIRKLFVEANADETCAGVITWMHTFSPSKMWIGGFSILNKPLLHFHTQFNSNIPWDEIDMDFMNLNQSAHGDREHGFIGARMRIPRKVVVGHWQEADALNKIGAWMNVAAAHSESQTLKIARFGDNMREVAVTEGDKVAAQIKLGWSISGFGIGDLVKRIDEVSDAEVNKLMEVYEANYEFSPEVAVPGAARDSVREQARIELGLRAFLTEGGFTAFTTNFEDLYGMKQLPGLAVQRLMEDGYGFGGEGDWKTAALVRMMKIMSNNKATSFMEDYTYNFDPSNELILGSHMLEVCPTVAQTKPRIEVHPLGIGGKADPARIVFDGKAGHAIAASLIDMGDRFRLIINDVNAVKPERPMPKLPVARVIWRPEPSLRESAEAWILAGGAHHTSFSFTLTDEHMLDWAEMLGIECVVINKDTNILNFKNELRWNELFYKLK